MIRRSGHRGCRVGVGQGCESQHERRAAEGEAVGGVAKGPAGASSDGATPPRRGRGYRGHRERAAVLGGGREGTGSAREKGINEPRAFRKSNDRWTSRRHTLATRGLWRIDTTRGCDATGARRSPHGAHSALGARSSRPSSPRRRLSPRKCGEARVESEALSPRENRAGSCSFPKRRRKRSREIAGCAGTRGAPRRLGRSWGGAAEGYGAMRYLHRSGRTVSRVRRAGRARK